MRHYLAAACVLTITTAACNNNLPTSSAPANTALPSVTGPHQLTFTPSPVCHNWPTTPIVLDADVTQSGDRWVANVPGALSHDVSGTLTAGTFTLTAYVLTVSNTDHCWLTVAGTGLGKPGARPLTGPFDGALEAECPNAERVRCVAVNHTFALQTR